METATALARSYLAQHLGCAEDELTVLGATAVTWPDSALGCRQPGMLYMQVLTPGYQVVLRRGTTDYQVHTDHGRRAVHCSDPGDALPAP